MTNYAMSHPAVNGETVTQGHADYCRDNGHATYRVDGVDQGMCPRCGEVTRPYAGPIEKDEHMDDMTNGNADYAIPDVYENRNDEGVLLVTIEDRDGGACTFPATECADLASTLRAIADRVERGAL